MRKILAALFVGSLAAFGGWLTSALHSKQAWGSSFACNTVGYLLVKTTGYWGCAAGIPANPVWWGADPTGTSDSTSAIQAAWNAAPAIKLPPGTFHISTPLASTAGVAMSIDGSGPGVTVLDQVSTNQDGIDFFNTSRQGGASGGVSNLSIETATTSSGTAIYCKFCNAQFYIHNVYIGPVSTANGAQSFDYGIRYINSWYTQNDHITIIAPIVSGILLDACTDGECQGTGNFSDIYILCSVEAGTGVFYNCPAGTMGHGIELESDGGSQWNWVEIWRATGPGFLVYPPGTGCPVSLNGGACGVSNQWVYGLVSDTSLNASGGCVSPTTCGDAIRLDTSQGGNISGFFCTTCWETYGNNSGLVISGQTGSIAAAGTISTSSSTITMSGTQPSYAHPGERVYDVTNNKLIGTVSSWSSTTLTLTTNALNAGSGSSDTLAFVSINDVRSTNDEIADNGNNGVVVDGAAFVRITNDTITDNSWNGTGGTCGADSGIVLNYATPYSLWHLRIQGNQIGNQISNCQNYGIWAYNVADSDYWMINDNDLSSSAGAECWVQNNGGSSVNAACTTGNMTTNIGLANNQ